jgi:hypothetical protein
MAPRYQTVYSHEKLIMMYYKVFRHAVVVAIVMLTVYQISILPKHQNASRNHWYQSNL